MEKTPFFNKHPGGRDIEPGGLRAVGTTFPGRRVPPISGPWSKWRKEIAQCMDGYKVVVVKSTVPGERAED